MSATAAGMVVALGGLAACQHLAKITSAGTPRRSAVTVITLQMPDAGDPDGTYFAEDVASRSNGSLKVVVDSTTYNGADSSYGARLVAAMRAGQVGFSYDPARDWAAAGVPSFQALQAPFLITTVHASEQFANSPLAGTVLQGLSTAGMVGIGLIPTQPRQILSTRPLFAPAAFSGLQLRIINNPQAAALVSALGAHPVQDVSAAQLVGRLRSRSIEAVETSAISIGSNSYNAEAPYLTSYAVIPKFETIVATQSAWAKLSPAQQTAIRAAAADTLANSIGVPVRETSQLASLCRSGLVLDEPSSAALAALVSESQPAMPTGAAATSIVAKIKATIPGAGPRPEVLGVPLGCHDAHSVAQARALHALLTGGGTGGRGVAIPPGTYVTTLTLAGEQAGNVTDPELQRSVTWIWHIYADRKVFVTTKPYFSDQWNSGHFIVTGRNQVTFIWTGGSPLTPETVRWSYFDGQLTFAIVHVQDPGGRILYTAHPWRKVS